MTRERWRQLEELYQAALELNVEDRNALLGGADPELRAAVTSILAQEANPQAAVFSLDRPAWEVHGSLLGTLSGASVGAQWGPYRMEQQIGRGGMGEVFRAIDTRLHRTVAIKISAVHFSERFEREARAIAALNHPNIATLYDVGSSPSGLSYLVLEYVDGPTLADLISKGAIEQPEIRRIALETAEALEAAHDKGIVHRDLKPANIKLGKSNAVKILDFGLAKALNEGAEGPPGEKTQQGMILGTPFYMSPEQALGGAADRRSDIWSFGVVVGEMQSGKHLFSGNTTSEILTAVVRGEPDLSGVPAVWLPLLKRCLTKDVRRRLQAIGEARIAIENGLETASQPGRRIPWAMAGLAAALCLLAASLWAIRTARPILENPLANATFTPFIDYEGNETDASISPDGKFVAFMSDRGGVSHVWLDRIGVGVPVDITPGAEDQRAPLRSIGFSHDGAEIWVAGTERRRLRMLPLLGGKPRFFLSDKAVNPIWSPDGLKVAYHTSEAGDPIFVADSDGSHARQIFRDRPGLHNHYLAWGADDNWIYFVHGVPATFEMDLWRISAMGGPPQRLTTQSTEMRDPTPLRHGTILYIARARNQEGPWLWSYDLARHVSHRIAFGLEQYTSLSASADGQRLAVTVANPTASLWSIPLRDSAVTEADVKPFPTESRRSLAPRFRGAALYYLSAVGAADRLWRREGGRSNEVWGATAQGLTEPAAISPDGTRIVLIASQNGKRRLRMISADGTELQEIAPDLEVEGSADWSPDGRWIVTGGNDGKGKGLFKIPAGGGSPVRVTKTIGRNPVWSPDGSLIAYSGENIFTLEPLLLIHPDGAPVKVPEIRLHRDGERFRFVPDGRSLVYMKASEATPWQDFYLLNLTDMKTRRLSELTDRAIMRTFDVTPDGKQIVFDREQENSAVVLIEMHSEP